MIVLAIQDDSDVIHAHACSALLHERLTQARLMGAPQARSLSCVLLQHLDHLQQICCSAGNNCKKMVLRPETLVFPGLVWLASFQADCTSHAAFICYHPRKASSLSAIEITKIYVRYIASRRFQEGGMFKFDFVTEYAVIILFHPSNLSLRYPYCRIHHCLSDTHHISKDDIIDYVG